MKKKLSSRLWFVFALLFALGGVLFFTMGKGNTLLLFPHGSPEETADAFFAAIEAGDYTAASELCSPALPLENLPQEKDAELVYTALCASRHYTRDKKAEIQGNHALIEAQLTVLDIASLTKDMNADVNGELSLVVSKARRSAEIYKEDGSYRDDVVMEAWNTVLSRRLEDASGHTKVLPLRLSLIYSGGAWRLETNEELVSALAGGLG